MIDGKEAEKIDSLKDRRIIIRQFVNKSGDLGVKADAIKTSFPDELFQAMKRQGISDVIRDEKAEGSVIVEGSILKYDEGNRTLRMLFGFWAGRSYFYSDVSFIDGVSHKNLGVISVRRASWLLGGFQAVGQTPEVLMHGAAKTIVEDLQKKR